MSDHLTKVADAVEKLTQTHLAVARKNQETLDEFADRISDLEARSKAPGRTAGHQSVRSILRLALRGCLAN